MAHRAGTSWIVTDETQIEARPIARFSVTNWLAAVGRSLPEGYNYGFDCRETATSCAFLTGSIQRQDEADSLRQRSTFFFHFFFFSTFDLTRDVAFLTLSPPARVQTCPLPSHDMYERKHIATEILVITAYGDEAVVVLGPTTTLAMQEKIHPSSRSMMSPSLPSLTETPLCGRSSPPSSSESPQSDSSSLAPPFPPGHRLGLFSRPSLRPPWSSASPALFSNTTGVGPIGAQVHTPCSWKFNSSGLGSAPTVCQMTIEVGC